MPRIVNSSWDLGLVDALVLKLNSFNRILQTLLVWYVGTYKIQAVCLNITMAFSNAHLGHLDRRECLCVIGIEASAIWIPWQMIGTSWTLVRHYKYRLLLIRSS